MKKNKAPKIRQYHQQQIPNNLISEQQNNTSNKKGRQDNSLSVLTKKFVALIKQSENHIIDLNIAVQKLNVQKRRIYDITNVLQGINYVQKIQKNMIRWIGDTQQSIDQKQIQQKYKQLQLLSEKQKQLNQKLINMNNKIKMQFLQNQQSKKFQFITFEDVIDMNKAINKDNQNKVMVLTQAPTGTSLQISQQKNQHFLKMNSQGKGPVKLYTCTSQQGVQLLQW